MPRFYFIGIGGTAMGAVAIALARAGATVHGSDHRVYPPMSDALRAAGISWFDGFDENNLNKGEYDVIVAGNAVSRGNPEIEWALDRRRRMTSLPELVRNELIGSGASVVVSGTHGKTTTTSLAAWLLDHAGLQPGFMIGAVPANFEGGCRLPQTPGAPFVVEGDEYDSAFFDKRSKFVHYRPDIAIVNAIEFDHADIFGSLDEIKRSFRHMLRLVPRGGLVLARAEDINIDDVMDEACCAVERFGFIESADWRIEMLNSLPAACEFRLLYHGATYGEFSLPMAGEHNVANATAAIAAAKQLGVSAQQAAAALKQFKPPKRRLELLGTWRGMRVVDDFAHHPTAIRATLNALRGSTSGRLLAVFEPRSNTTTRNIFQRELATAFDQADLVVIAPLNRPDRYAASERLNLEQLKQDIESRGPRVFVIPQDASPDWGAAARDILAEFGASGDLVAILSNGAVGGLRQLLIPAESA